MGGTNTTTQFTITPLLTDSYSVTPQDDFVRLNINDDNKILTLPSTGISAGKIIYVSNIGNNAIGITATIVNPAFNSVGAQASGILIYIGGNSWDWLSGY